MYDVNAFERQVADEALRMAGPSEQVDDAAIFAAVTATRSPRWRVQSMFSAAKLVVAGAIVALFGGALLAAVLTQPIDERIPAAVTAPPSPITTDELLAGMDTEEVEPGVFRVLSDGVREPLALYPLANVVAGMDGSVVLWDLDRACYGPTDSCTGYRLGDPETFSLSETGEQVRDLGGDLKPVGFGLHEVGSDGTIWGYSFIPGDGRRDLRVWDGDGWVVHMERKADPSEVEPGFAAEGTAWAVWSDHCGEVSGLTDPRDRTVSRLTAEGWKVLQGPEAGGAGWLIGSASGKVVLVGVGEGIMRATTEGLAPFYDGSEAPSELVHYCGGRRSLQRPAGVADDGTLWWRAPQIGERPADLVRFDGSGWQTFEIPEVARMGPPGITVAPDGSVWLGSGAYDERGNGLHRFDGTTWTRFLPQLTIFSLDIGPDGAVWFIAKAGPGDNRQDAGLYVITPEAVAATA